MKAEQGLLSRRFSRWYIAIIALAISLLVVSSALAYHVVAGVDAEVINDNNNVDGGTPNPGFDAQNRQTNETSVSISPANSDIVAVGANDYRMVTVFGDSWLGFSISADGAAIWFNTMVPRYVQGIMIRTFAHRDVEAMAAHASVPVMNGLTDLLHPCQVLADVLTMRQHLGSHAGRVVAWVGDGNNMANSWVTAAERLGFTLRLACPESLQPPRDLLAWAKTEGARITVTDRPEAAVNDAHCVVTDTWVSMGDEEDAARRRRDLDAYRIDDALLAAAAPDAVVMHPLPRWRGRDGDGRVPRRL